MTRHPDQALQMDESETINFSALERELEAAVAADKKYQRENDAKFRAIHQKVASYEEFRDIVQASHLKPLDRKDKVGGRRYQPWNSLASSSGQKVRSQTDIIEDPQSLPETAAEFNRDWRRHNRSGAEKYNFLLTLGGKQLGVIFKNEIAFGLLGELLLVLSENFITKDQASLTDILYHLSQTKRFGLNVDFLSKKERDSCLELFQKLLIMEDPGVETRKEDSVENEKAQCIRRLMKVYNVQT
ncbi:coiled-coil domain-containing protein 103 isoform X1 [Acipenser ruthenus]|nr:coiled-coil domain-containing protein 103 isoform X1 [Acipenser ruthenus]